MGKAKRKAEDFGNQIPRGERILAAVVTVLSLYIAWDLVLSDQMTIVEYRRSAWLRRLLDPDWTPEVVVLHGWPIFWAYLLLCLIAIMALTVLFDHYDRRFNARFYVRLRRIMLYATILTWGVGLLIAGYQMNGWL